MSKPMEIENYIAGTMWNLAIVGDQSTRKCKVVVIKKDLKEHVRNLFKIS